MKGLLRKVAIGLALAAAGSGALASGDRVPEMYPWLDNLDQARAIAVEQRKPMLIVFRCVP